MNKLASLLSLVVALGLAGCAKRQEAQSLPAKAYQELGCQSKGLVIHGVQEVAFYKSYAVEVFYLKAPGSEASEFFSPSDRFVMPQFIEDLPKGQVAWASLEPNTAWIVDPKEDLADTKNWTCVFNLKIHLSPGSRSVVISDRRDGS